MRSIGPAVTREQSPAFLRNSNGRLDFPGPTQEAWIGFFLEFYLTFFCFPFTAGLSVVQGLVIFAAISLAIIIPTPNGAGPWHFVVISMMTLYGVSQTGASSFALIVHAFQTLGVMLLGAYGWVALQMRNRNKLKVEN